MTEQLKRLNHHDIVTLILSLGIMLILSRIIGEIARKFKLPMVVGELITGIILGKTIMGNWDPALMHQIFPAEGRVTLALNGITSLAVIMLLFVAGMEVELSILRKNGKKALFASMGGFVIPMAVGVILGYYYIDLFHVDHAPKKVFALFLGTALSISALPVIARTLLDLGLYKTRIGTIVIAAAMIDDLVGWLIFSIVLSLIQENKEASLALWQTVALTFAYTLLILTVAKYLIDKSLPWFRKKFSWPGGVLSLAFGFCFLGAAFTEYIGIHAIFGAFIMGIAFGDSEHLDKDARQIIQQFVTNIFAPLFFVSIGLQLDFIAHFDLKITLIILTAAIVTKTFGATLGSYIGGLKFKDSLAVGFGMNARGAMEIILARLAFEAGLINETIFVSLVIMAILTSILSGPMLAFFCRDVVKVQDSKLTDLSDSF
jgi:Kef-type K+ transport system membrane component KefB